MACNEGRIARYADDPASMTAADRAEVEAHLRSCSDCRDALDAQRAVAAVLRERLEARSTPGFVSRVSARIDREDEDRAGLLGLANWRAWTVGLAPVAAALMLMAYLGAGSGASGSTTGPQTFSEWATSAAATTPASVFLQPDTTGDALIEAVLKGATPSAGGVTDGR